MARYHDNDHLPSHRSTPVRANREVRDTIDAFLESSHGEPFKKDGDEQGLDIVVRCCFERLGRAPWNLTGKETEELFEERLPRCFEGQEKFLDRIPDIFSALIDFLEEDRHVAHLNDVRQATTDKKEVFLSKVKELEESDRSILTTPVDPIVATEEKVGRNDPCPCGSGKKYKKCHG